MKSIAIIGCGNIGSAIAFALLNNKIIENQQLTIVESFPNPSTSSLSASNCTVYKHISDIQHVSDVVILAVKPQNACFMYEDLLDKIGENTLVISVMAGVSTKELSYALATEYVIRAMPNTPCSQQQGMTVYYAVENLTKNMINQAELVFAALGKYTRVSDEHLMNAATAISGTGPAYIFYLAEALMDGAMELGFTRDQSKLLATQTILGAAGLLEQSDLTPETLRKQVTSPGGTTEAAIKYYQKNNLKKMMINGYHAACNRSVELGKITN